MSRAPVIHVLDASKSVVVASSLLDRNAENRQEFLDDINELYEEEREAHYASLKERTLLSLAEARQQPLKIDFAVRLTS